MNIILASASPRRRDLLSLTGFDFTVIPADCEEVVGSGSAGETVESLARQKAEWVAEKEKKNYSSDTLVIGADTVVSASGVILGKPKDENEAFSMLRSLSGREHEVYTGVSLISMDGQVNECFSVCTKVKFYELSDSEINEYIATKEPLDKAGAYGIQGRGGLLVESISGDYNNVVGLPLAAVVRRLRAINCS